VNLKTVDYQDQGRLLAGARRVLNYTVPDAKGEAVVRDNLPSVVLDHVVHFRSGNVWA
jgi:hypothetical protein